MIRRPFLNAPGGACFQQQGLCESVTELFTIDKKKGGHGDFVGISELFLGRLAVVFHERLVIIKGMLFNRKFFKESLLCENPMRSICAADRCWGKS